MNSVLLLKVANNAREREQGRTRNRPQTTSSASQSNNRQESSPRTPPEEEDEERKLFQL